MSEAERALSLDPTMVGAYANLGDIHGARTL